MARGGLPISVRCVRASWWPSVVAAAVGAPAAAGTDAETSLLGRLRQESGLLVLDNLEHLDVSRLVARLHEECPRLRLLATSRHPLLVAGEQQYPVSLLAVPDHPTDDPDELPTYDAVRLLVDRARAADPGFRVTPATARAVAAIVKQVDGLPLALEIVAPWLRVHSPDELADRLAHPLDLRGRRADRPQRQRTLRDTIEWSYELLPEAERTMFRRLAVFAGSFSLENATLVGGDLGLVDGSADASEEAFLSLIDGHLVQRVAPVSSQPRFRLLQTVREYAVERLAEDPEQDAVERPARHGSPGLGGQTRRSQRGTGVGRVACAGRGRGRQPESGDRAPRRPCGTLARLQLAVDAMTLWFEAGHEQEGEALLGGAIEAAGPTPSARAIALLYWAWLRAPRDTAGAATAAEEALALARRADDPLVEAFALQTLGDTLGDPGRAEQASRDVFVAAERGAGRPVRYGPTAPDAVRCGASASIAASWTHRSVDEALRWQQEALRLAELEGDRRITAVNAARLARLHVLGGDLDEAGMLLQRARALVSTHVTARWEDIVAFAEAELLLHRGAREGAELRLRALVDLTVAAGRRMHTLLGLLLLADLHTAAVARPRRPRTWPLWRGPLGAGRSRGVAGLGGAPGPAGPACGPDRAAERLGAVEPLMPEDALPSERVIWLLESATLRQGAEERSAVLDRLRAAEERTGVRLAPWEASRRTELTQPV